MTFSSFHGATTDDAYAETASEQQSVAYDAVAVAIFVIVSYTFLFPCNFFIPLDRRTVAVLGATLCYCTRTFIFQDHSKMNMLHAVDFDVLVLLASIMAINHIIVHLKETKSAIRYMQREVQKDPQRGFWLVSFASFIIAPFLTNDGVCLLFVELILNAFEGVGSASDAHDMALVSRGDGSSSTITPHREGESVDGQKDNKLEKEDALYFLLTLACSSNIGSALTYTGNPQNMIVAQDSVSVMPPLKFLGIMLLPSVSAWLISKHPHYSYH
jgi:Na+/H+ antiporter NhaD/arsenite permease-like protein